MITSIPNTQDPGIKLQKLLDKQELIVNKTLEDFFRKNIAPMLAKKIRDSRIEQIKYSMGVYFAVLNGELHGDGGPQGHQREFKLLHYIAAICEDDRYFCRSIDAIGIINEFVDN